MGPSKATGLGGGGRGFLQKDQAWVGEVGCSREARPGLGGEVGPSRETRSLGWWGWGIS